MSVACYFSDSREKSHWLCAMSAPAAQVFAGHFFPILTHSLSIVAYDLLQNTFPARYGCLGVSDLCRLSLLMKHSYKVLCQPHLVKIVPPVIRLPPPPSLLLKTPLAFLADLVTPTKEGVAKCNFLAQLQLQSLFVAWLALITGRRSRVLAGGLTASTHLPAPQHIVPGD